jgi:hypothetical protein
MATKRVTERGQSKPSPDLALLIDVANADHKLPELLGGDPGSDPKVIRLREFKSLNPEIRAFLGEPRNVEKFQDRYHALRSAQQVLPLLAERWHDYESSQFTSLPFSLPVNLYVRDGTVGASGTFLNALRGVRADRIRRCAVCKRVFWASRTNSECCGQKCRKTYNKRNSRAAEKKLRSKKREARKGR